MANAPAVGLIVDGDFMVEVQGDLRGRGDVNSGEGLAIEFFDPLTDVADPATED
ncbi:hypothetical protein D3C72_2283490 [compost metagenome]